MVLYAVNPPVVLRGVALRHGDGLRVWLDRKGLPDLVSSIIALVLIFQRRIVSGLTAGAVKG